MPRGCQAMTPTSPSASASARRDVHPDRRYRVALDPAADRAQALSRGRQSTCVSAVHDDRQLAGRLRADAAHDGQTYSAKAHEFRKFVELPRLSSEAFEIALDIHPKETKALGAHGRRMAAGQSASGG